MLSETEKMVGKKYVYVFLMQSWTSWLYMFKLTLEVPLRQPTLPILVVYYPSKETFIEMSTSEEYAAIGHHRHLSLEYGGLIATETMG